MIWYNLKLAYRNIVKNKQSYLLNVSGLIIALTVSFISLLYVAYEHISINKEFDLSNLYHVQRTYKGWNMTTDYTPVGLSQYLQNNIPGVKDVITYTRNYDFNVEVSPGTIFSTSSFQFADSLFIKYKTKKVISGTWQLLNQNDLLLTKDLAIKYFGTTNCIGRHVIVHGHNDKSFEFVVSGVFEYPIISGLSEQYNHIARLDVFEKLHRDYNYSDYREEVITIVSLEENADTSLVMAQVKEYLIENIDKDFFSIQYVSINSFKQKHLSNVGRKVKTSIIISVIILLIALFNFVIYNNARFWERSKTTGIKKLAGCSPIHIFRQTFTELFAINLVCVLIALLLSASLLPVFKNYLNKGINLNIFPIHILIAVGLIIILSFSVLEGLSSLFLSSGKPIQLLTQNFNKGQKGKLVNSTLIMLQVGVFTFLLIMFFTTSRQLNYLNTKEWGFDSEQLVSLELSKTSNENRYYSFKDKIQQIPGIVNASGCAHIPPSERGSIYGTYHSGSNTFTEIEYNSVDYGYLKTLGINVKLGRDFNPEKDHLSENRIIVNQSFLDLKNIVNPLDTLVKFTDHLHQIIGVVNDFHLRGMDHKIRPLIIHLHPAGSKNMLIKVSPVNMMRTLETIESSYKEVYPTMSFNISFVEDEMQNLYLGQKRFNKLMSYYAIIAIFIACMGLFGFVINEMNKRIKEVGIRKVNGARVKEIISLLNYDFINISLTAFLVASPLAYIFSKKWLEHFAYKTSVEWWIFLIVGIIVHLITLITISIQTMRVAGRNPIDALRYE